MRSAADARGVAPASPSRSASSSRNSSPPWRASRSPARDAAREARRDLAQQLVAGGVAEGVVDELEVVEVEVEQRDARVPARRGAGQREREVLPEQRPVRQAGQRVVVGQVARPAPRPRRRSVIVDDDALRVRRPAGVVAHDGVALPDRPLGAVDGDDAVLAVERGVLVEHPRGLRDALASASSGWTWRSHSDWSARNVLGPATR